MAWSKMSHGLVALNRCVAAAALVALAPLPVLAQPPPPAPPSTSAAPPVEPPPKADPVRAKAAVDLHDEAHQLYEAGEYHKAIEKLERALTLDPEGAELAYNIALIYEKLGDVDKAEQFYRKSLELEKEPGMREKLEGILKRIEGAKREMEPRASRPAPPMAPSAAAPAPPAASAPPRQNVPWLVAGTVAAVGFTVGTSFAVAAVSRNPGSEARTGPDRSIIDLQDDADAAHTYAIVADVSFLVGTLATGLAVYFFFGRDDPGASAARAAPWLDVEGGGVRF